MNNRLFPCIWMKNSALNAARFYKESFRDVVMTQQDGMVSIIEIAGCKMMLLNGGPHFTPNPTISFYMICEGTDEIDTAYEALSSDGKVMMPLDKYVWSERYCWIEDKYGVSWQLTLGKISDLNQKVTPALLFTGNQFGNAEQAMQHYISIFDDAETVMISRYDDSDELQGGKINHGQFSLMGQKFICMDSGLMHGLAFSEGVSIVVTCRDQEEIDHYWESLSREGEEGQCGWLKDKYGVSWQIVPEILSKLMSDPEKANRVTNMFMKMKKLDMDQLLKA